MAYRHRPWRVMRIKGKTPTTSRALTPSSASSCQTRGGFSKGQAAPTSLFQTHINTRPTRAHKKTQPMTSRSWHERNLTLLLLRLVLVSSQWQQQRVDSHHDVWAIKHRNGVMVRLENEATFLETSQTSVMRTGSAKASLFGKRGSFPHGSRNDGAWHNGRLRRINVLPRPCCFWHIGFIARCIFPGLVTSHHGLLRCK
jgi:hypothetical protein